MPEPRGDVQSRLQMHRDYWDRKDLAHPLVAFRITPDFFLSRNYHAAHHLLVPGKVILPEMLVVDDFLPDYERMYQESEDIGQDAFFTAEPYISIPWMEAMLGCEVTAGDASFISRHYLTSPDQLEKLELRADNPWLEKYLEFAAKLVKFSEGRFPIGQPILRGPVDVAGALMGQAEMVMAMVDEPELMRKAFLKIGGFLRTVDTKMRELVPPFHGGEALGFYHVWTPGRCIWYQEDLATIISPDMYDDFLREPERNICQGCQYTFIHLHPAAFFILDNLLENDFLAAIQVNKDVGGPSVPEMLPKIRRIAERKNFVFWGDLTLDDIKCLRENLSARGLFFFTTADDLDHAKRLLDAVRAW
ncbi:MAG: hypothetical protein FWG74_00080 [Planctomycetes bacterium]|nr:hypothetical protein [Planctomycetota bacterium]